MSLNFFFSALRHRRPKHFVPNKSSSSFNALQGTAPFESFVERSILTRERRLFSLCFPLSSERRLFQAERTSLQKKERESEAFQRLNRCFFFPLSTSRPRGNKKRRGGEEKRRIWRASSPPPRGLSPTSRAQQTKRKGSKQQQQEREEQEEKSLLRPPLRPAGASGAPAPAAEAPRQRGRSAPTWSSPRRRASSPCSSTRPWARAACRAPRVWSGRSAGTRTAISPTGFSTQTRRRLLLLPLPPPLLLPPLLLLLLLLPLLGRAGGGQSEEERVWLEKTCCRKKNEENSLEAPHPFFLFFWLEI